MLVAGAGISLDAVAIRDALGKDGDHVVAPDFALASVTYQHALGVTSMQQDLLVHRDDWDQMFNVVVDAAMTEVFTANWNPTMCTWKVNGESNNNYSSHLAAVKRSLSRAHNNYCTVASASTAA